MPMMGWGSLSRCSAGISIGPEGVVVFPERAEPVGEPEVHEAHLGLEVGILDGSILACFEEKLEVPVVEADLPEGFDLVIELNPERGTQNAGVHAQLGLDLRSHQDRLHGELVGNRAEQSFRRVGPALLVRPTQLRRHGPGRRQKASANASSYWPR